MSETDEAWVKWFKENFPREYYLEEEITKRTEDIFRTIPEKMPEGKVVQIMIGMAHNPMTGKMGIAINPIGAVFLGALSKGIMDSLTAQFEGLLSSEIGQQVIEKKVKEALTQHMGKMSIGNTKTCSNCGSENQISAKFCDQCANKF